MKGCLTPYRQSKTCLPYFKILYILNAEDALQQLDFLRKNLYIKPILNQADAESYLIAPT